MNTTSAALHRHTPVLLAVDPRGLPINSLAFYREHASDEPEERVNRSEFDAAGRLIACWDPRLWGDNAPANLTTIYSLGGQALSSDSVDAGWRLSLSGEGGQVVDAWDGRGTIKQVEYDELLRPTAVFEDGEQVERLLYGGADLTEFNQVGQLIQHDDPAGTRLNNRFALTGEVIEQTQEFADDLDTTRWRFNALGEALEQTDALGNIQRFAHTVAGQLKGTYVQLKNRPEQQLVGDIRYDAQGRVEFETAGNGVISTALYRPEDGRLRELKASRNNGELLQHLIYDYDPAGNVTRIEDHAQPTRHFANQRIDPVSTYHYDTLYQLIEATGREAVNQGPELVNFTQTYRYDSGGNMRRLTHVGGQDHSQNFATSRTSNRTLPVVNDHVPDEEEIAAAFDANGNLRELQAGQALTWDRRNQLQQVRPVIRESGIDDSERYIYNASGQRTRKIQTTLAKVVTHSAEVRYLPGLEIRTDTATGEVLHVVTAQAGCSNVRVLHWQSPPPGGIGNDQVRYSLNDHLGSSLLELDNDAQIISQEGYYPFGGTAWWATRNAVEASYKTVRYSGKERDATGLYYYGLRYYAPWLLRWINPDPAGAVDGLNAYTFIGNNPISASDGNGLMGWPFNRPTELSTAVDKLIEIYKRPSEGQLRTFRQGEREEMGQMLEVLASLENDQPILNLYSEGGSGVDVQINNFLRNIGPSDTKASALATGFAEEVKKLSDYGGVAYRAMTTTLDLYGATIKKGDIVSDSGYLSASVMPHNVIQWMETWVGARKAPLRRNNLLLVIDKDIPKKVAATSVVKDHVLVLPNELMKVKSIHRVLTPVSEAPLTVVALRPVNDMTGRSVKEIKSGKLLLPARGYRPLSRLRNRASRIWRH
ncbi:RHS repeat domain-containing protein [Pseudomonas sp. Pseusp122]|uniref:RHS repeat domain-containing protein n=1 Tax=unclassified Pseudomonas TaxID=196821 RepID=UPI0039A63FCF